MYEQARSTLDAAWGLPNNRGEALVLGASAGFWLNLQNSYDLTREQVAKADAYAELAPLVAA